MIHLAVMAWLALTVLLAVLLVAVLGVQRLWSMRGVVRRPRGRSVHRRTTRALAPREPAPATASKRERSTSAA